ncbi:acVLRF1 family peptidyl-tRNA hydrolase [Longispora urticae]
MASRPAVGGGRWVDVAPARLDKWIAGFAERHGGATEAGLTLTGGDGETAEFHLTVGAAATLAELVAAANEPYRIALILARRGGYAVGVAAGDRLTVSKVDTKYVQSRTAAGGWSQQRFARRRANQARQVWDAAADTAVRVLVPAGPVSALVCGGDRQAVDEILTDPRLAALAAVRVDRFLEVADPRLAVLEQAVLQARSVRVLLSS